MWRGAVFALVLTSCAGAPARPTIDMTPPPAAVDRLIDAARRGDHAALAGMLDPSLVYGGLWFDDVTCREPLAAAGRLAPEGYDVLARCLATLPLAPSARASSTPGVAVLVYEPGIEIEVAFTDVTADAKVSWIGFVGRRGAADALPTISRDALEALRADGPRVVVEPDPAGQTWLKLCLDATGAVTSVHPRATSSPEALAAALATATRWTFRPFELGGQPAHVCAMVALAHPSGDDVARAVLPVSVPGAFNDAIVVSAGEMAKRNTDWQIGVFPDDQETSAIRRSTGREARSEILYCVDRAGAVVSVSFLRSSGYPRLDARLAKGVMSWRFTPFELADGPVPVCSILHHRYSVP